MTFIRSLFLLLLTAVVEPLTLSAQLPSLPIGSTNAVLNDALRYINDVAISVQLLSKDELSIEKFLYDGYFPYSLESGQGLGEFIRQKLARAIGLANFNKPEYAGRKFQTTYGGSLIFVRDGTDPNDGRNWAVYLLLATDNWFTLEKNDKGELVAPKSAYTVDLVAAVMRSREHGFFADGVVQTRLELEDGNGNITAVLEGTEKYNWETGMVVRPADGVFSLPIKYAVEGQPGKVTLWYANDIRQVFSLSDGHLLQTMTLPRLAISKNVEGIELLVKGVSLEFIIESSQDMVKWEIPYSLISLASSGNERRFLEKQLNGRRFYRVRIEEPVLQKR